MLAKDSIRQMIHAYDQLETERKEVLHKMEKLQHEVKEHLVNTKMYDALSINWSMLRRMTR